MNDEPDPMWVTVVLILVGVVLGLALARVAGNYPATKQPVPAIAR